MTQSDPIPLRRERRRLALCLGLLAGLALIAAAPAQSTNQPMNQTKEALAGSTVAPAPTKATTPAAPVLTADTRTVPGSSGGQSQRRLLLLLLVHSAGPLGPYGALGR